MTSLLLLCVAWYEFLLLQNQNVAVSEAQLKLRFACGQSYLFKVAAFNKMGSNQYKISKLYTTEGTWYAPHCSGSIGTALGYDRMFPQLLAPIGGTALEYMQ